MKSYDFIKKEKSVPQSGSSENTKNSEDSPSSSVKSEEIKNNNDEMEKKIEFQNAQILQCVKKNHKEKHEAKKCPNLTILLKSGDSKEKGFFQEINLFRLFGMKQISCLWKIWEIVLTNQPLLIISDSPTICRYIQFLNLKFKNNIKRSCVRSNFFSFSFGIFRRLPTLFHHL